MKKEKNSKVIEINTKIYPLDIIYAASYVLIDRCYIILDGDPKKKIKVTITPKEKKDDLKKEVLEFNNQLISYAFYKEQSKKNSAIRQILLQAALLPVEDSNKSKIQEDSLEEDLPKEILDDDFLDDPEGIAIPWEEKYKSKDLKKKNKPRKKKSKK